MCDDEGDDEEEMSSQPAPVQFIFQQAAEHLWALRDFGLLTNQPQYTASICQAEILLKLNNAVKRTALGKQL